MAEIAVQYEQPTVQTVSYKWETITAGDSGQSVTCDQYPYRTITVEGTFDGTTITIQGRNDEAGTWQTLQDNLGNNLSFTAAGIKLMGMVPRFVRPLSVGGTTVDIDVVMTGNKQ